MSLWEFVREKECVRAYASLLEREREREGGLNENIAVVVTSPLMVRLKAPSSNT